jgi:hypothetical protein
MPVEELKSSLEKMGFKERAYKEGTKLVKAVIKRDGFQRPYYISLLLPNNEDGGESDNAAADRAEELFNEE